MANLALVAGLAFAVAVHAIRHGLENVGRGHRQRRGQDALVTILALHLGQRHMGSMGEVYVARQAIDANPRDLLAVFGEHFHLWFVRVISPSLAMAVDAVRDNRKLRQSLILSPWMTSQALHICLHVSFVTEGHGLLDWLVALARRRGQSDHRDRRDKEKPDIHH